MMKRVVVSMAICLSLVTAALWSNSACADEDNQFKGLSCGVHNIKYKDGVISTLTVVGKVAVPEARYKNSGRASRIFRAKARQEAQLEIVRFLSMKCKWGTTSDGEMAIKVEAASETEAPGKEMLAGSSSFTEMKMTQEQKAQVAMVYVSSSDIKKLWEGMNDSGEYVWVGAWDAKDAAFAAADAAKAVAVAAREAGFNATKASAAADTAKAAASAAADAARAAASAAADAAKAAASAAADAAKAAAVAADAAKEAGSVAAKAAVAAAIMEAVVIKDTKETMSGFRGRASTMAVHPQIETMLSRKLCAGADDSEGFDGGDFDEACSASASVQKSAKSQKREDPNILQAKRASAAKGVSAGNDEEPGDPNILDGKPGDPNILDGKQGDPNILDGKPPAATDF